MLLEWSYWECIIYSRERLLKAEGESGFWIFAKKAKRKRPAGSSYSLFKLTGIAGYVSVMTKELLPLYKTKASK